MGAISEEDSFATMSERIRSKRKPTELPPVERDENGDGPAPPKEVSDLVGKIKMSAAERLDGLLSIFAPSRRGKPGKIAGRIKRKRLAQAAQRNEVIRATLDKASRQARWMSPTEQLQFFDRAEDPNGPRKQATADLDEAAALTHTMLNWQRAELQKYGVLDEYIENYMSHMFKDPQKAQDIISGLLSKRKLLPKGFLKKRKHLTFKDGIDAGLEPAIDNPIEMQILRMSEMNRYMACRGIVEDLKHSGNMVFVASDMDKNYTPAGWVILDDVPDLALRISPNVTIAEAYDKLLVDQLVGVASRMGISQERLGKMKAGRWGESGPGKNIKTRFAGPVSVLAHEIGHQIGDIYGLFNFMLTGEHTVGRVFESGKKKGRPVKKDQTANRAAIRREFRALADLRSEGQEVSKVRKQYQRKQAEKEAVILEAWLAAPEKMAEVAPKITAAWKTFLESNETLTPLLSLNRSVVLGSRNQEIKQGGVLTLGHWAMPKEVATIISNHLSPGFGSNKNILVRNTYDFLRQQRNLMLQISHGLSAFHGINIGTDAINSYMALGFQKLGRGDWEGALESFKSAPGAFTTAPLLGREVARAMRQPLEDITDPVMRMVVEGVMAGGGQASLDAAYRNDSAASLVQSIRGVKFGKTTGEKAAGIAMTPMHAAMAAIEKISAPIMKYQVPYTKLGVMHLNAMDIYEQANKKGWDDVRIADEMAKAWNFVENRMGQLNYDNLNWHRMLKEVVMVVFRAPGWTLGSIREFGGAVTDTATLPWRLGTDQDVVTSRMGYAVGAAVSYAIQGFFIQWLLGSGEPPEELKDLYFPKTGRKNADGSDERLSMPHYTKDIIAWSTDPIKTIQHKLNPIWGSGKDLWDNEDYFGRAIRGKDPEKWLQETVQYYLYNNFTPFSVRNAYKLHQDGVSITESVAIGLSGISPAPAHITRTPAQKRAIDYLRGRGGKRHVSQEDAEHQDRRRNLIRDLRSGKIISKDSERWEGFTFKQRKSILRDSKQTAFETSFKRLTFDEAVNVFAVASKDERLQVWDRLLKKRIDKDNPDPDVLAMYYYLKLTQAQVDAVVAADIQVIRNAAWGLSAKDLDPLRRDEIFETMMSNKQYEKGMHFAAFNHRWLFTLSGKRSGRKIGTASWRKRIARLSRAVNAGR